MCECANIKPTLPKLRKDSCPSLHSQLQGHFQAHTGAQCFATVSGLNDMFPGNGVQRGLRFVFSCLVGVYGGREMTRV